MAAENVFTSLQKGPLIGNKICLQFTDEFKAEMVIDCAFILFRGLTLKKMVLSTS